MTVQGHGFILTRQHLDERGKTRVQLWLKTPAGPVSLKTDVQDCVMFIQAEHQSLAQRVLREEGLSARIEIKGLKTFVHQAVAAVYFAKPATLNLARKALKNAGITCYEDDIRLPERYLMERFVYGSCAYLAEEANNPGALYPDYLNARVKPEDFTPQLSYLSLDIECSESGELYSIGLSCGSWQQVMMIGKAEDYPQAPDWILWVEDEAALLRSWVEVVLQRDPDLFIGWNVITFDFRLLIERAQVHGVPLPLGRGGEHISYRTARNDAALGFVTMPGRVIIDGIDGLKQATYQFESFSLESVAQSLLGEGKATEDVDSRLEAITRDFLHNKTALAKYNIKDCQLVESIFSKTRLIDFLVLRSRLTGLELDRMGGSVAAFVNLYLPRLHRAGYVSPNRPAGGGLASPGGYVMNSIPGLYRHVLVLDFKSLYPSIIRTFKIDPLGLVEGLAHSEEAIPGFKGAIFSRDKHFLPDIITSLWRQRDEAKRQKDAARSQAIKILMNSFYGVLGSGGCPFYDTRLASSITMRGHEIMQTTAQWITEQGYKVIYGDTDSTFVWLDGDYNADSARKVGKQLQMLINQRWQDKLEQELQLDCALEIEFETHFDTFLMPTIRGSEMGSKKRYAGAILRDGKMDLVFKGLESVRSDWTPLAREFQRELYQRVFEQRDVQTYLRELVQKTQAGVFDDKLVYRKRLRQAQDKYVKSIPPHVKAARLADQHLQSIGKPPRYQRKGWVTYVLTTAGPEPTECIQHPLDYHHYIDKQLRPIAEGILPFIGLSFDHITGAQLSLL